MFGLGGTSSWFSTLDSTVGSWVGVATKPFQGGFVNGLESVVGGIWEAGKANPYATAVTLGIGAITIYAYKNRGFGVGLGSINLNINNFLAHLNISTGLGRQKTNNWHNVDQRLSDLEAGLAEQDRVAAIRHNNITREFTNVKDALEQGRRDVDRLGQRINDGFDQMGRTLTTAYEQRKALHAETQAGLQAIAGESAGIKANVLAMRPQGAQ